MTVDAPAAPAPTRRPVTAPQPAPAAMTPDADAAQSAAPVPTQGAATDAAATAPATGTATGTGRSGAPSPAPNANPRANPDAPYQVMRSASDKLPGLIVDLPRSVTIIPKEVMEDKGATSLRELVRTTPGLTLGSGEGGNAFGDRVLIRGFDARNDMFIDGVRQSGVTTRETFMAEEVEILAGPAGSVVGRGSAGGAINIVTKQPLASNFTQFDLTGGTDGTARLTADVNQNVSDKFAIRLNLLGQRANVSGRDYVFDNRYGAAIATLWKPTDEVRVNFDYYFIYFDQLPDWGVPFDPRIRQPFTESGVNRNNFYGIPNRDFQHNYQHLATAGVEWDVTPYMTLKSKMRYSYTVTDYVAGKAGTPNLANVNPNLWTVPSTPASRYQTTQMIANQTDAVFKFDAIGAKHTLVTGVEASREMVSQDTYTNLSIECFPNCTGGTSGINLNLFYPNSIAIASTTSPTRAGRPNETNVNTLSGYVINSANWDERWFLNLGARLDDYNIERTPYGSATLTRSDLLFNWNAGLTYKVLPNTSLYVAYATSSNPVGSEIDGAADAYGALVPANVVFKPELNTAFEAGVKSEFFEKRLRVTGAAFQTTKDNAREQVGAFLRDTAAYRVRGLEFSAAGKLTERWSLFGGAVFLNTRMTESAIASDVGRPLANVAHQSFNILTKYAVTDELTLGAQATYKSELLGGTLQAVSYPSSNINVSGVTVATPAGYNRLPGGWRFDLFATYKFNENLSARFQVINVLNSTLYDAFYRSNTPFVYIAPGRTAYFTLTTRF